MLQYCAVAEHKIWRKLRCRAGEYTGFCRCQRGGQVLKSDWYLQIIRQPYSHRVAQGIRDAPALTISPVADVVSETAAQLASDPKITRRPAVRIMKPMIWIL